MAKSTREQDDADARQLAGIALGTSGVLGHVVGSGVSQQLGASLYKNRIKDAAPMEAIARKMGIEAPARVEKGGYAYAAPWQVKQVPKFQEDARKAGGEALVRQAKKGGIVYGPRGGADAVAHELGHAANWAKNKGLSSLSTAGRIPILRKASLLAGGIMSVAPEDAESAIVKAAPLAPGVIWAPLLADEALASVRGYKGLKSVGKFSPQVLKKARGNLMKAFGTYLIGAAKWTAPVAAASAARIAYTRKKRKREKTKEAAFNEELIGLMLVKKGGTAAFSRGVSSLFGHAYKEDEDFRQAVKDTLVSDPYTRRNWRGR